MCKIINDKIAFHEFCIAFYVWGVKECHQSSLSIQQMCGCLIYLIYTDPLPDYSLLTHWVLVIFSREEMYVSFHYHLSTFRCYKLFKSFAVEAKNERRCTRMAKHESQTMEQNIKSNKILQKWHSLFAIIAVQGHRDQWIKFKFK